MRTAILASLALLAACSSDKPVENDLVTLDDAGAAAQADAPAAAAPVAAPAGLQAVDAEGAKLEPIVSSAVSAAGLDSGACRFSPAAGALPVLVAATGSAKAIISLAGRQIELAPSGTVAATGGSFAGQGVTLMVSAGGGNAAGSKATMQVSDADGPAFAYQHGFWACN